MIVEFWTEERYKRFITHEIRWDLKQFNICIGDGYKGYTLFINDESTLPTHLKIGEIPLETSTALADVFLKNDYPKYIVTEKHRYFECYREDYLNELKAKNDKNTIAKIQT